MPAHRFLIVEASSMTDPYGPVWWNNTDGWGDRESAEAYRPEEMYDVVLPMGGCWLPDYELDIEAAGDGEPDHLFITHDMYVHTLQHLSQRVNDVSLDDTATYRVLGLDERENIIDIADSWLACETCHPGTGQALTAQQCDEHGLSPDWETA